MERYVKKVSKILESNSTPRERSRIHVRTVPGTTGEGGRGGGGKHTLQGEMATEKINSPFGHREKDLRSSFDDLIETIERSETNQLLYLQFSPRFR
jgi:hypothetical protein